MAYGAGWVTAADRGLLLQLIRGPARIAALDVPGLDPLALALSGKTFVPSPQAEAFLANQLDAVRSQGVGRPQDPGADQRVRGGRERLLPGEGDPGAAVHRATTSSRPPRSSPRGSGRTAGRRRRTRCSSTRSATVSARRTRGASSRTCARRTTPRHRSACPGSFPQELPSADDAGQRRPRRRELQRARRSRRRRSRSNALLLGSEAFDDRPSAVRRGAAGRLLLPAVLRGDGALRRRLRRPRGRVPGRARSCWSGAGRTSPGARRRPRPTTSTSSRRRSASDDVHYLYRGAVRADEQVLRRDAQGAGPARPGDLVLRDVARPGDRVRDRRRASASRSPCSARRAVASSSRRRAFYALNTGR